ncbi:hypothetical protein F5879DRAFT_522986 [Lentinula edodes]|nr:hypothetical protein F5879DRAFT_522986 [Lentinula edodes]
MIQGQSGSRFFYYNFHSTTHSSHVQHPSYKFPDLGTLFHTHAIMWMNERRYLPEYPVQPQVDSNSQIPTSRIGGKLVSKGIPSALPELTQPHGLSCTTPFYRPAYSNEFEAQAFQLHRAPTHRPLGLWAYVDPTWNTAQHVQNHTSVAIPSPATYCIPTPSIQTPPVPQTRDGQQNYDDDEAATFSVCGSFDDRLRNRDLLDVVQNENVLQPIFGRFDSSVDSAIPLGPGTDVTDPVPVTVAGLEKLIQDHARRNQNYFDYHSSSTTTTIISLPPLTELNLSTHNSQSMHDCLRPVEAVACCDEEIGTKSQSAMELPLAMGGRRSKSIEKVMRWRMGCI